MKRSGKYTVAVAATVLGGALLLGGCTGASHGAGHSSSTPTSSVSASKDGDIAFAQMMIVHHGQAVEMADMALASSANKDILALAEEIKAAQGPEIAVMEKWLQTWGASGMSDDMGGHDMGGHDMGGHDMAGMMTDEQMQDLAQATGEQFDAMWLEMMIAHHEGAVLMAQDVLASTNNMEVAGLAETIVTTQEAEIAQMSALLSKFLPDQP